jgi:hypothetical protein
MTMRSPSPKPGKLTKLPSLLTVLLPAMLLAGCVNDTASYMIDNNRDHAVIVMVSQKYFWSKQADLRVLASRLPECQRSFEFGKVALDDLNIELFSTGEESFLLRAGEDMWQIETGGCTQLGEPAADVQAQPIGVFHMNEKKNLVFEKAEGSAGAAQ